PNRPRTETTHVIRDSAPTMREDEFEIGEIVKYAGFHQRYDANAFFIDELQRVGLARVATAGRVYKRGHVKLAELLVQGVPVLVAQAWRRPLAFGRVRV